MSDDDAKLRNLAMLAGVAIMHDVRMVVREELERVGLSKAGDLHDEIIAWRKHLRECREATQEEE